MKRKVSIILWFTCIMLMGCSNKDVVVQHNQEIQNNTVINNGENDSKKNDIKKDIESETEINPEELAKEFEEILTQGKWVRPNGASHTFYKGGKGEWDTISFGIQEENWYFDGRYEEEFTGRIRSLQEDPEFSKKYGVYYFSIGYDSGVIGFNDDGSRKMFLWGEVWNNVIE